MNSSAGKQLDDAIADFPDELREPVSFWLDRLDAAHPGAIGLLSSDREFFDGLARLVAVSDFAAVNVVREWDWISSFRHRGMLEQAPDTRRLESFAATIAEGDDEQGTVKRRLRRLRNRWLLHVLWREVQGTATLEATLHALSDLADHLLAACCRYANRRLQTRFGVPRNAGGDEIPVVVLAMGKLGGRELNFSSDIDLIFLYTEEGETDGKRTCSAHEYFTRLIREIAALLDEATEDGFVFRIDTRLRPFGESGPPVVSFAALEAYLPQHGRDWERYAYVKARIAGPPVADDVADELMNGVIKPFVYRRYLDYGVFESLREMKALIEAEVRKKELASNIKLGPGGIREIEFIAQSLQLVRGGNDRRLRSNQLQAVLPRLASDRGLSTSTVNDLITAYAFLRRLENFIQAIRDQQSHELPTDPRDRARLCMAMNFDDWGGLVAELDRHRHIVSRHFEAVAFRGDKPAWAPAGEAAERWTCPESHKELQQLLGQYGVAGPDEVAAALVDFQDAPAMRKIDKTARKRIEQFLPNLIHQLQHRPDPSRVVVRVLRVIEQVLRRSAYIALLNENPPALEKLVNLCENSAYLADEISRFPLLLDELLDPRLYSAALSAAEMEAELAERFARLGDADSEQCMELLVQFHRATLFRIAVADFNGSLPIMKVSDRLTDLAELVLARALELANRDLTAKHGLPRYLDDGVLRTAGFGVIAYGKLGGIELSYRSDLDLVFLHEASPSGEVEQITSGAAPLESSVFFGRLVRRLVHFLTTQTGSGMLYEVDTRLRPDGRSGLLVTSVDGFERYQEEHAWTWEHQALLRSRPVAGSAEVAREFERIRAETLRNRVRRDSLLEDVTSMRQKMRAQLDRSDDDTFDLKHGRGGIGDIEFVVQYLVLRNARSHPAVIHYTDNIRQLGTLAAAAILPEEEVLRLQEIYKAYRLTAHRLALDEQPPLVAEPRFAAERAFVSGLWERTMQ